MYLVLKLKQNMAGDVTHSIQVSIHWRENSNKTFTEKCVSGKKLSDHVKVMQEQVNSFLTQLVEEEKKSTTAVKRNQEDDGIVIITLVLLECSELL